MTSFMTIIIGGRCSKECIHNETIVKTSVDGAVMNRSTVQGPTAPSRPSLYTHHLEQDLNVSSQDPVSSWSKDEPGRNQFNEMIPEGFNCMPPVRRQMKLPEDRRARGRMMRAGFSHVEQDKLEPLLRSWSTPNVTETSSLTGLLHAPAERARDRLSLVVVVHARQVSPAQVPTDLLAHGMTNNRGNHCRSTQRTTFGFC